ncbi:hypothetical protein V3H18_07135 [Methylocystis sp. 9N]|uniref:Uncharacterized protein n=1 Tax=Methylocystis borbori TaxID=3118750 RepID=A0ABU7XFY8_9HYPH
MSMGELMTGVALESFCAILTAFYFVAECALQESAVPAREAMKPGARR